LRDRVEALEIENEALRRGNKRLQSKVSHLSASRSQYQRIVRDRAEVARRAGI